MRLLMLIIIICALFSVTNVMGQSGVRKIIGSNVDATVVRVPCSTFNITGPLSSVTITSGNVSGVFPLIVDIVGFETISGANTFGFLYKLRPSSGAPASMKTIVGSTGPLSIIVDNTLISYAAVGEEGSAVIVGNNAGYIVDTKPANASSPALHRTFLLSAFNGSIVNTQDFVPALVISLQENLQSNTTFDGGKFYSVASVSGGNQIAAWSHGAINVSASGGSSAPNNVGKAFDDAGGKVYTLGSTGGPSPIFTIMRWNKFNGTSTVFETELSLSDIYNSPNAPASISFSKSLNKLFLSGSPLSAGFIVVSRHSVPSMVLEQSVNLSVGDGATYTNSRSAFDNEHSKFYLISNSNLGRRIFRINPLTLSVEQTFTVSSDTSLLFSFNDANLKISDDGRKMWTLEQDATANKYVIREYRLCS